MSEKLMTPSDRREIMQGLYKRWADLVDAGVYQVDPIKHGIIDTCLDVVRRGKKARVTTGNVLEATGQLAKIFRLTDAPNEMNIYQQIMASGAPEADETIPEPRTEYILPEGLRMPEMPQKSDEKGENDAKS